jgi:hypothetical protein
VFEPQIRSRCGLEWPPQSPPLSWLNRTGESVNIHLSLTPLISLIAGILILLMPKLLNFIVAIYLILIGLVGLFGTRMFHIV